MRCNERAQELLLFALRYAKILILQFGFINEKQRRYSEHSVKCIAKGLQKSFMGIFIEELSFNNLTIEWVMQTICKLSKTIKRIFFSYADLS